MKQRTEQRNGVSIKQKDGCVVSLGFMVLHWILGGGHMASNLKMFQQRKKKKTTS